MNKVSVIIPYFKKKKFIQRAVHSVLNQSYKNFDIIIIYDDENLKDLKILNRLKKKSKKIKILINKNNLGAGLSRNKGIKYSKSKYIAFLDADDFWHPEKLKAQIKHMIMNNLKISHTSYYIVNNQNKILDLRVARDINYKSLLKSCDIGLSTVLLEKKILNTHLFPDQKTKEDYILWLKISKKYKFIGIDEKLVYWRNTENSLSSSIIQKLIDGYRVYRFYEKQNFIKSIISLLVLSFNYMKKS
jgi:teichuronic acid biosynthesis glycosyltransferase TuaG